MWYASDLGAGSFRCSLLRSNVACLFLRVTGGLHLAVNPLCFHSWSCVLNVDCDMSSRVFLTQMLRRCFSEPRKFISCPLRISSVVLDIKSNPEILFYIPHISSYILSLLCHRQAKEQLTTISSYCLFVWFFFFQSSNRRCVEREFYYMNLEKCIHINFGASFFTFWCRGAGRTHLWLTRLQSVLRGLKVSIVWWEYYNIISKASY